MRKSAKVVTEDRGAERAATQSLLEISSQKAAADASNKVKQDLAKKELEPKAETGIGKNSKKNKPTSTSRLETGDNLKMRSNCNTWKKRN